MIINSLSDPKRSKPSRSPGRKSKKSDAALSQYSLLDTGRVDFLAKENEEILKNLGLYDFLNVSITKNVVEDTNKSPLTGGSRGEQLETTFPMFVVDNNNAPENDKTVIKGQQQNPTKKVPPSLDLKKLSKKGSNRNNASFSHKHIYPINIDSYQLEEAKYFQYNDFDDFVDAMSRPTKSADMKKKVLELRDLAHSMKEISENPTDDNVEKLLKKFTRGALPNDKPYYKRILEQGGADAVRRKDNEENEESREVIFEEISPNLPQEKTKKSKGTEATRGNSVGIGQEIVSENRSGRRSKKMNTESTEKMGESFEMFLKDQGMGATLFRQSRTESPVNKRRIITENISPVLPQGHPFSAISPNIIKELIESKAANLNSDGSSAPVEPQTSDLVTSLQYFLLQNLREIEGIKDLLQDNEGASNFLSLFSKKNRGMKSKDKNADVSPLLENEEENKEKKFFEGQIERLLKKVQTLNKKIQDADKENERYARLDGIIKRSFRAGKVRITDFIRGDVDVTRYSVDEIDHEFDFEEKFITISASYISIETRAIDKEEKLTGKEDEYYKIFMDGVESIVYLEKPGSNFFVIRCNEAERVKNLLEVRSSSGTAKSGGLENKGSYIVQIQDQREILIWELAFLVVNFRIMAKNIEFSYNKKEFLQALRLFLSRYLENNGDANLIFSENSPSNVSRLSLANNKLAAAYDPIPDLVNESTKGYEPPPPRTSSNAAGMVKLVNKVQTMIRFRGDGGRAGEGSADRSRDRSDEQGGDSRDPSLTGRRPKSSQKNTRRSSPNDEENKEIDEYGSNNSQMDHLTVPQQQNVASMEEGGPVGSFEEKSNMSMRSSREKKKPLTPEQEEQQTLSKYLSILLEGVALEKYGKWGTKREKLLRVSNDFTGLEWRDPKRTKKLPDFIMIDSISRIDVGAKSEYFKKKKLNESELAVCFTVVSSEKNLNLRAPDVKKREIFVEALQYMLQEKARIISSPVLKKKK